MLLNKGADFSVKNEDGDTVLSLAARFGLDVTVQALLTKNVDVNIRDDSGIIPLAPAIMEGHQEIITLLKNAGTKQ